MSIRFFQALPKESQSQVKSLYKQCFPSVFEATNFEHKDKFCSEKDKLGYIVVQEGEEIVGAVAVLKRTITYQGSIIGLGGLGGMSTRPDKRRQGIGTKLLNEGMQQLKQYGCDIAYICADIKNPWLVKFYEKAGFEVLGRPHRYVGKSGKRYIDHDAMIAPVNSQEQFDLVMKQKSLFDIGVGNW